MPNKTKRDFLKTLSSKYGNLKKIERSQSLFKIINSNITIYIRYSKLHPGNRMFYGLREEDLRMLEGTPSVICFLWDKQINPIILNFTDYEEIFQSTKPASDGQFKVQIYLQDDGTEFYIAKVGRFNVESNFGFEELNKLVDNKLIDIMPDLSHSNVQTLLGAIGKIKGPCGDSMRIDLKIESDKIVESRFWTDGCGPSIASGNMLCKMIKGKTVKEVKKINFGDLLLALDGLPVDNQHCTILAVNTLRNALNNYRNKKELSVRK